MARSRNKIHKTPRSPLYTTFQPGELEQELRALSLKTSVVTDAPPSWKANRRHRFQKKWHECRVTFPDETEGTCNYIRHGPTCHTFGYKRGEDRLPHVTLLEELPKDAASLEAIAQEKAAEAFGYAIWQEQGEAKRAQPPWTGGNRKADPATFQLSRERAIQLAGRYALCYRLQPSGRLLPSGGSFETLEETNQAWREKGDSSLFVAIAVRWSRRWTLPVYNSLYAEHPRPTTLSIQIP
jgi:hypothetical protein